MSVTIVCNECGHKNELDAAALQDLKVSLQMCQLPHPVPDKSWKLTICLDCEIGVPTLAYPEHKLMPVECVALLLTTIKRCREENTNVNIWTCSDVPVNYVGELIGNGTLKASEVSVKYCLKTYHYDEGGYLIDWPYGTFSWRREPLFVDTPIYKCPVCAYTLSIDLEGREIPCCPRCNTGLILMDREKK